MKGQTIYLSKAFGLFACIEWGLSDFKVVSPLSFTAKRKGRELSFFCHISGYGGTSIEIPAFEEDFLMLLIEGKPKDNFIILNRKDIEQSIGQDISLSELPKIIKYKSRFEIKRDILHDSPGGLQEE